MKKKPPEKEADLPRELDHVWTWFTEIFNSNGVGFGPYRTEYSEIEAYARVTNQIILPWEARLIRAQAQLYTSIASESDANVPTNATNLTTMKDTRGLRALFMKQGETKKTKKSS